ncbi:MAG: M20/M25/M40 family metallo-hydrolase [Henriciella sp.]
MIRLLALALLALSACSSPPPGPVDASPVTGDGDTYIAHHHDADRALAALQTLSSDEFEGRRTGTPGNLKAREWIKARLTELGAAPAKQDGYESPFAAPRFDAEGEVVEGTNLVAFIRGTKASGRDAKALVMTAHYDHLGIKDGEIFNGADDNASGVAALLETIAWFQKNPPENHIIFAFFDAEEGGIVGSAQFLAQLSEGERGNIALNLNLDMVARADKGELYAVGGYHFPELVPVIDGVAAEAPITLLRGHDSPDLGDNDWSFASDHAPFLRAGIPIIYLGVEDHADYHRESDEFDKIDPAAFARCVDTVILMAEALDTWLSGETVGKSD